jgi:hypothetical protein
MKIKLTVICFLATVILTHAQNAFYTQYKWEQNPVIHKIPQYAADYPAVFVLHNRFMELRIERSVPYTFFTEHKIMHINANAGIEQFNKVYIPMSAGKEIVQLNVRAISPDGRITVLRKENLKELTNVEGYGNFKIFAIEGLELGGELEYLYTTKSSPVSYGREIFQKEVPVLSSSFDIICPSNFLFLATSYNGLSEPKFTALEDKREVISVSTKDIPALKEEQYSAYRANLLRVDWKLETTPTKKEILTWHNLSERIVRNMYSAKIDGEVIKMLKLIPMEDLDVTEKVQMVERYIKTNFIIKNTNDDAYEDAKEIMRNRVANEQGIIKIYVTCWSLLRIPAQLVLAPNRFQGTLDPDFPSPLDFTEVLFYFPTISKYLTPGVSYMRLGPAPSNVAGGEGLFISYAVSSGGKDIEYENYDIKSIPQLEYDHNQMGVKALIEFNDDLLNPVITQENSWQGYRAARYRGYYYFQSGSDKNEFIKQNTLSAIEDATIISRVISGEDINLSFDVDKYFSVKTKYGATSLIEKAGEDYLVSVGKVIGKQSELYQEKQRQTDIAFQATSKYTHEIVVMIPRGYECSGLESIKINNEVKNENEVLMRFDSDYTLEAGKLIIRATEFYKVVDLPKEKYEDFRKVVNSAADFNKIVVVLHPIVEQVTQSK